MPMPTPPLKTARPPKSGYLASLDGWRAIAVLGVLIAHDQPWTVHGHTLAAYMGYGGYGVNLFFAISGFLITTRILEEEALCGRFDIRRFYIRRVCRIQPASFAFLAVVALLMLLGMIHDTWSGWLSSLLLYVNFSTTAVYPHASGHFWTLAVEEHFYLLLSLVLFCVRKRRILALSLLYAAFALPLLFHFPIRHGWYDPSIRPHSTQWQLHYLLIAALAAVLVRRTAVLAAVKRWLRPGIVFAFTLIAVPLHHGIAQVVLFHQSFRPFTGLSAEWGYIADYFLILWVLATVFHPASLTTRCLELPPMRFLGRISYSLYLWHVLVYFFWFHAFTAPSAPWAFLFHPTALAWLQLPCKYAACIAVAALSYRWIEKPMIRLGHRLAPPATPGRPEFADLPVETPLPQPVPDPAA